MIPKEDEAINVLSSCLKSGHNYALIGPLLLRDT